MGLYNLLLTKILLPLGDIFFKTSFYSSLANLRKQSILSEKELTEFQLRKLTEILEHSTVKSMYYKKLLIQKSGDSVAWLKKFPILTKQILNRNQDDLLTESKDNLFKHCSSGSSGVQATVYMSRQQQDIDRATQILWWEWAGYKIGDPLVQTSISPKRSVIKTVKDIFFRTKLILAFSHREDDIEEIFEWVRKKKRPVIAGYASSIFVLSQFAEKKNIKIPFKTAIVWGDKLFDHYRTSIEKNFNTRVHETYGTAEGFKIAVQKDLNYMYIMTNNVFLEILDNEGNEVADGEMGHVVVTSLNSFAMPLIRYRIGDLAIKLPKERYPANRELNFPLLQKVIGRDTDIVKTVGGKYMVVHAFTGIFEYFSEIKQFSVVQDEVQSITIEYIPAKHFDEKVLDVIRAKIEAHTKDELGIFFKKVTHIPPSPSGKPQLIRSSLRG